MNAYLRLLVPVLAALAAAACGTTSELQQPAKPETASAATPTQGTAAPAQTTKFHIDLSGYDKVVVLDFTDGTDISKLKPEEVHFHSTMMANHLHTFSDIIAQKIVETKAYSEVVREPSQGKALIVSGKITRLVEGNGALRFFVGFGAGSSYFDAMVQLTDAESGNVIASASSDNNSWVLGGGLAATQTVQSFMDVSATRIAARLRDGKKGPSSAKAN